MVRRGILLGPGPEILFHEFECLVVADVAHDGDDRAVGMIVGAMELHQVFATDTGDGLLGPIGGTTVGVALEHNGLKRLVGDDARLLSFSLELA